MKKRVNGAWEDDSGYKAASTHVDYTSFPIAIEPTYTPLNVVVSGNMTQIGTPTPENPIQPQECGELETVGAKAGQYKIPILSADTTTPVYLGEVQSTRLIRKLVLTGDEYVSYTVLSGHSRFVIYNTYQTANYRIGVCSHYKYEYVNANNTVYHDSTNSSLLIYIFDDNYTTADDFKTYLQQQYANGTPVTVWYVLATPTTGIVNEPLRKIGDYADEVFVKIPVTIGEDTIDVSTTIKPSKLSVLSIAWNSGDDYKRSDGAWA